jgi:hypothetical protein
MSDVATVIVIKDGTYSLMILPRGEINDDVILAYQTGQCMAFAQAFSELTGWPVVWVFSSTLAEQSPEWAAEWDGRTVAEWRAHHQKVNSSPEGWSRGMYHAMVESPDGKLIDINCCGTPQQLKDSFNNYVPGSFAILKATAQDLEDMPIENPNHNIALQDVELAREYAKIRQQNAAR